MVCSMLTHPFFHALGTLGRCLLRSNQGFDGLALIHRTIARSNLSDLPTGLVRSLTPIRPQIGSTNTGMGNLNHGISWCENGRIRDLLHLDSKCSTKHGCTHRLFLPLLILTSNE